MAVTRDHRIIALVRIWPCVFHPFWSRLTNSRSRASPVKEYTSSSKSMGKFMQQNRLLKRGGRPRKVARLISIAYRRAKIRLRTSIRKKGTLIASLALSWSPAAKRALMASLSRRHVLKPRTLIRTIDRDQKITYSGLHRIRTVAERSGTGR